MSSEPFLQQALARRESEVVGPRLRRWEAATERPLTAVGVLFLVAYAVPIAVPEVGSDVREACAWFLAVTWAVFAADYVVRVVLARRRWVYVRRHPLALAVVLVPALRPLLLVSVVSRLNQAGRRRLRGKVVRYAAVGTVLLVVTAALVVTQAERGEPGSTIETLGDGVWWALVTVTTVGYGDMAPVTTLGRTMAVLLMLGGIALLGVVTATLSSWLVELVAYTPPDEDDLETFAAQQARAGSDDVDAADLPPRFVDAGVGTMVTPEQAALLMAELRALRGEIAELRARLPEGPA
ncbi:voltage-gated potassium channel [Isoptericola jiangsuensis]|uniref:Voltage-gated potassium channel n=1 Tax=Isoptericola jiangsuensis TaxID=548579 RepID=A0A2A9ETD5_9MICO|nr:potassium channel family protein [Isoptericola jiangsuensis]PFG42158.1 voltage-gated potassium channel [Isoptericola jiangsuensis]